MRTTPIWLLVAASAFATSASAESSQALCEESGFGLHSNPDPSLTIMHHSFADPDFDLKVYREDGTGAVYLTDLDLSKTEYVDTTTKAGHVYTYFMFKVPHGAEFDVNDPWSFPRCENGLQAIPTLSGTGAWLAVGVGALAFAALRRT